MAVLSATLPDNHYPEPAMTFNTILAIAVVTIVGGVGFFVTRGANRIVEEVRRLKEAIQYAGK